MKECEFEPYCRAYWDEECALPEGNEPCEDYERMIRLFKEIGKSRRRKS